MSNNPNNSIDSGYSENNLGKEEIKFRNLFNSSPYYIFLINQEGKILDCNPATEKILGYIKSDVVGKDFKDSSILPIETYKKFEKKYEKLFEGILYGPDELQIYRKDRKLIWVHSQIVLIKLRNQYLIQVFGHEITEKKEAEQKLKESEKKYKHLFYNSPLGIFIFDENGNLIDGNTKAINSFSGISSSQSIGKNFLEILQLFKNFKELAVLFKKRFDERKLGKELNPIEFKLIRKDGSEYWVHWQSSKLKIKERIIYQIIAQDITERKQMELRLRESEENYRLISENANDMIAVFNSEFEIEYINEYVHNEKLGYKKEDLIGLNGMELIHPDDQKVILTHMDELINKGKGSLKLRIRNKEGQYICTEIKVNIFTDNNKKKKYLMIGRDITERIKNENLLKDSEEKFRFLFENSPVAVALINKNGIILEVNSNVEKMSNFKKEELIGKNILNLGIYNQEELLKVKERIKRFSLGEKLEPNELLVKRKDGSKIWLLSYVNPINLRDEIYLYIVALDITEKKKTQQQLIESEEKYRGFIENFQGIAFQGNIGFKPIFIHGEIEKITGYKEEDFINSKPRWDDIILPEDKKKIMNSIINLHETPNSKFDREYRIRTKDNKIKWIYEMLQNISDKNNKPYKVQGVIYDITEKKIAELKIKESEEKYRFLFENSPSAVALINKNGTIVEFNSNVEKFSNFKKEGLIGRNILEIGVFNQKDLQNIKEDLELIISGKKIEPYEILVKKKDGSNICLLSTVNPIKLQNELYIYIAVLDITEKKNTELKLKESEENYRLITENVNDLIAIINEKIILEYVNRKIYHDLLGFEYNDIVGKTALNILHPDDIETAIKLFKEGWKNGSAVAELRVKHKDGRYSWLEIKGKTYINSNGVKKGILIGRDITSRKKNQENLIKSELKYREAYKRGNLYEDLFAHDINNILQNIKSSIELSYLYIDKPKERKKVLEFFGIIQDQIVRGTNLVSNVIKLFKIEESMNYQMEKINLKNYLEKAIEFVRHSYRTKNLKIRIEIFDENIMIMTNDFLLDVFENILFNAVTYNFNNLIEIIIKISKYEEDNSILKLEFIDNGFGISDDQKKKIFEKKLEGKRRGGMGLGLSLVKKIIQTYHGEIMVEDRIKGDHTKGSNFIILIPKAL